MTKDERLERMYDAEELRSVTIYLTGKEMRRCDRKRKIADSRRHTIALIIKAYKRGM